MIMSILLSGTARLFIKLFITDLLSAVNVSYCYLEHHSVIYWMVDVVMFIIKSIVVLFLFRNCICWHAEHQQR